MFEFNQNKNESFLAFSLNDELFAVSANKVLEVLDKQKITKIPKTSHYILGIVNFRGEVLPVIDARRKLNMQERNWNEKYVIAVFDLNINEEQLLIGAIVDSVKDVLEINLKSIQNPPKVGLSYNSEIIEGVYHSATGFIKILDIDKVFSNDHFQ